MAKKKKIIYSVLYTTSFVFLLVSLFNFLFINKILPGVTVADESYAFLTKQQALQKINTKISDAPQLTIKINENVYTLKPEDVNFYYDKQKTVNNAFMQGRGDAFVHLKYIGGLVGFKMANINYSYSINEDLLNVYLATITAKNFPKNQNAHFALNEDGSLIINEADEGDNVNLTNLKKSVLSGLNTGQTSFVAQTSKFTPNIYANDLAPLQQQVEQYLNSNLQLTYKNYTYTPTKEELINILSFTKQGDNLLPSIEKDNLTNLVKNIASNVNVEAKALSLQIDENNNITFDAPVTGVEVKEIDLFNSLSNYVVAQVNQKEVESVIEVPVNTTKPDPNQNKYGITELIAEGVSHFKGSSAARVSNIKTASEKIKGTLVAPGEVFSFNEAVGPITIDAGFNTAYVINKGRTVLGTGGGVCQVSTTVFRAALNSGLPIVERTAHAYRVSYYEQQSHLGLDATIYQPSVDLKFKNDTQNYVLFHTVFNEADSSLVVKIYGTSDGRSVEVTTPKVLSEIPPPQPVYEDDPSLSEGQLVQIEYPAWGALVTYNRIVKDKDGNEMYNDEFKSYYVPWAAVYKRGV